MERSIYEVVDGFRTFVRMFCLCDVLLNERLKFVPVRKPCEYDALYTWTFETAAFTMVANVLLKGVVWCDQ
jgi:hypothetical protein